MCLNSLYLKPDMAEDIAGVLWVHGSLGPCLRVCLCISMCVSVCLLGLCWVLVTLMFLLNSLAPYVVKQACISSSILRHTLPHSLTYHVPSIFFFSFFPATLAPLLFFLVMSSFRSGCHHYFPTRAQFPPFTSFSVSLLIFPSYPF